MNSLTKEVDRSKRLDSINSSLDSQLTKAQKAKAQQVQFQNDFDTIRETWEDSSRPYDLLSRFQQEQQSEDKGSIVQTVFANRQKMTSKKENFGKKVASP